MRVWTRVAMRYEWSEPSCVCNQWYSDKAEPSFISGLLKALPNTSCNTFHAAWRPFWEVPELPEVALILRSPTQLKLPLCHQLTPQSAESLSGFVQWTPLCRQREPAHSLYRNQERTRVMPLILTRWLWKVLKKCSFIFPRWLWRKLNQDLHQTLHADITGGFTGIKWQTQHMKTQPFSSIPLMTNIFGSVDVRDLVYEVCYFRQRGAPLTAHHDGFLSR